MSFRMVDLLHGKLFWRQCCKPGIKLFTGITLIWILCCVFIRPFQLSLRLPEPELEAEPKFVDYSNNEARTFHTVCLTNRVAKFKNDDHCSKTWYTDHRKFVMHCRTCRHPQKDITVYYDNETNLPDLAGLKKGTYPLLGNTIRFKDISQLPSDHVVIENQTAYFLGENPYPFEPDNFFHFTKQIYFPLYWLIKSTNQLRKNADNLVFYPRPYGICDGKQLKYNDISRFQYFRDILHVTNKLELSARIDRPQPNKICYRNAVFSKRFFINKASEATSYFKNTLNVVDDVCKTNILTIINRKSYRRILNVDELKKVATEMGYDARVVAMETFTLQEQAQLVHCTNVLVGVTGAGLQWAFFMRNHSGVVEVAWPDKEWHFFFTGAKWYNSEERDVIRPLNFTQLRATCHLTPPAINIYAKELFRRKVNISTEDSLKILQNKKNYGYASNSVMSVGKLCDVTVNPEEFRKAVLAVGGKLFNNKNK